MEIDLDKMMSEGCDYSGFLPERELSIRMNQLLSDILKDGTMTDLQALSDAVTSLAERQGSKPAGRTVTAVCRCTI